MAVVASKQIRTLKTEVDKSTKSSDTQNLYEAKGILGEALRNPTDPNTNAHAHTQTSLN